ncbi:MAG: archease [Planctomycetota bacterium]|jgi:SHS2 domain-containing protein
MADYRVIDHTGDIGIAWEGRDLPDLFRAGAEALADLLVHAPGERSEPVSRPIELDAVDTADLLVRFFQELLFFFETQHEYFPSVRVKAVTPGGEGSRARLRARVEGGVIRPDEGAVKIVIKAVTYHDLQLEPTPDGGWRAQVIFDV